MSGILDDKIVKIVREIAELPDEVEIGSEQHLRLDLGIDSLGMIDLVMHVETTLGIEIGEDSVGKFSTVGDLQRHVRELASSPVS
ncbi:acyl carrier protein [Streptomyces sp. NPDC002533]